MTTYRFIIIIVMLVVCSAGADEGIREKALKLIGRTGAARWLDAPVRVDVTPEGVITIRDEGIYFFQYDLETPQRSADPNIVIDPAVQIPAGADKAVFVTHGWIDKAKNDWPEKLADAIRQKTDPNMWVCGAFDWSGGSGVVTSIQAAKYARDVGGPRLAAAILKISKSIRHIHLIGHSAGSWVIDTAAKQIVQSRPGVSVHLTFLDAYVPDGWDPDTLGDMGDSASVWAEHYYTKDITYMMTQMDLAHAYNVDITAIDPLVAEHEFPYRWYTATVTGRYDRWDEKSTAVMMQQDGIVYGFARSLEAGGNGWVNNKILVCGNTAVKVKKNQQQ